MKTLFSLLALLLVAGAQADPVEVRIQNGPIVGETIALQPNVILNRFLGIPYAKPPVGSLRFQRPQPADSWTEPLKANRYPNNCVQRKKFNIDLSQTFLSQEFSEDCLYLNVWSPDVSQDEQKLRPVMIFIHGGGLVFGASSQFDSTLLSAKTDAVIVTINYRLSTLGFLYSDEVKEISGNQGFWDQALALEWVQDNIRYFGGDPRQVTIFGESAGSWSVSAHILSPVSRNLFKDAYMMSGSSTYGVFVTPEQYYARMMPGIRKTGCATANDISINRRVVECLQKLDAEKLDQIYYDNGENLSWTIAVIDGEFMPEHPQKMIENGDHKKNFNLMISTVEDEGSFMFYFKGNDERFAQHNPKDLSMKEAQDYLHQVVAETVHNDRDYHKEMANYFYFGGMNNHHDSADCFRRATGIAYGDMTLGCPSIMFGQDIYRSSPDSIQVYQVYYTFKMGQPKLFCSKWSGTCHSDELGYVFGQVFHPRENFHNRERDIANEITTIMSSFIRTGKPGVDHSEWHPYFMTADGQHVIAPYYELSNHYKTQNSYGYNLKHGQCHHLWKQFYAH